MPQSPLRVLIAGGGVAGLETLMALHARAGDRVELTLVAPEDEFVYRPLEVEERVSVGSLCIARRTTPRPTSSPR